ncbi:MAG TPA: hypothetical protein VI749_07675 [Candidatus Omnitrophota bacterium]|nr:hypothetical protein [Candidatus Omnitrophota bacterium]
MKRHIFLFIFTFLFLSPALAQPTYHFREYRKNTNETIERTTIRFEHQAGTIKAFFARGLEDFPQQEEYVLNKDYETVSWSVTNLQTATAYTGERKGNTVVIKGKFLGKEVNKVLPIDKRPFFAFPKIALTRFALSKKKELVFWALRNDELTVFKMLAQHKGTETISVNGVPVEAVKVYWSTVNPLFRIFKRTYYYRASDGIFLKQEYPDGKIRELVQEE